MSISSTLLFMPESEVIYCLHHSSNTVTVLLFFTSKFLLWLSLICYSLHISLFFTSSPPTSLIYAFPFNLLSSSSCFPPLLNFIFLSTSTLLPPTSLPSSPLLSHSISLLPKSSYPVIIPLAFPSLLPPYNPQHTPLYLTLPLP